MKFFNIRKLAVLSLILSTAFASSARADLTPGFDAILFDPAVDNTDYVQINSSNTLPKRGVHVGLYLDFNHQPLELGAPLGTAIRSINDDMFIVNVQFSYGFTDWFSVGINLPIVAYNDFIDPTTAVADSQTNMADIYLQAKFRLLNRDNYPVGIALIPFATLPSGEAGVFTGAGGFTGGAKLVLDTDIADRVKIALNVGYRVKQDATVRNARVDDQLLLGLGVNVKIIDKLYLIGEAYSEHAIHDIFDDEVHNPIELRGAVRYMATEKLAITAGGGAGLTIGVGSPEYRAFLGVSYTWDGCEQAAPVIESRKIAINQVIHFDFNKSTIKSDSFGILNEVAAVINGNGKIDKISVEGHTDAIGSDAYNQRLSNARANAVKNYLISKGVSASKLSAVGFGESKPVADNSTERGRAANRRTEFVVQ